MHSPKLILGSGSPRRAELLEQLGLRADDVRPPEVDETPQKGELPLNYCRRIAASKAAAMSVADDEVVLCADTTVALGRRIMGKPENADEAAKFLRALSGRRHKVITSVVVRNASGQWAKDVVTTVKMKRLSDQELTAYLASNDWQGKAGGYAIQGPAGAFVAWLQGSYTGVVGLPIHETAGLLLAAGYPLYGDAP
ncbi:Maf family protein [Aliiroseovarius lamellibrachiae]|uniref:Maf family protein n=1 Tax=Aliiroseovarius lamellibrachiae TaxID=1924933 RepID=UPI001BDFC798|nr:Maf family protein [Aliiroseovarius lamellibrachiae]MBT2130621.1 septum formation protein Maf [Aliiroseovarius lamellibrachiae]